MTRLSSRELYSSISEWLAQGSKEFNRLQEWDLGEAGLETTNLTSQLANLEVGEQVGLECKKIPAMANSHQLALDRVHMGNHSPLD